MTKHNQKIGAWGEDLASAYLEGHGHQIVARNVRTPYGEIDIITLHMDMTVFIEVKTLASSRDFFPEHNITSRKQEHMLSAAEYYASEHDIDHWRIDVIAVEGSPDKKLKITYFENAL